MASLDEEFMRQCLDLGREAAGEGAVPVGAIILLNGRVLGRGRESPRSSLDVTAHAEVNAIRDAARAKSTIDLHGATLYTNVEPCVLCSYAIRRSSIDRVVIGAPTTALGGVTSRYPILVDPHLQGFGAPPTILRGVLLDECVSLMDSRETG
jgi:tRNA(adenine34) deaminase